MIRGWSRRIRSRHRSSLTVGGQRVHVLQPPRARKGRVSRAGAAAVFAEDPAGEPAAAGGRPVRRPRRHPDARRLGRHVARSPKEIAFMPARVLLQDFTGVPAVVDLAAMRDGVIRLGGDPQKVNPLQPVELVIDHSVQVDHYSRAQRLRAERRARVLAQHASATRSCAGARPRSTTSRSCRPTPASSTRSTSSTSRA